MISEQMKILSHQLRLFGVHQHFEKRSHQAESQGLSHMEFLRLVLEDEVLHRKERTAKGLLTRAKFRLVADLEDWDQSYDRGLTKVKLKELASHAYVEANENVLILGRTGEGKTHLAVALGRRLCSDNIATLFIPVNFLFEEVPAAKTAGKYLQYIKKLTQVRVLILDDFGLRNYFVDLLEDRHRKGSVIVTSQADPKGWGKLFEDPLIAEAIVSRLEHPSQKLILKGGNYREKLKTLLPKGINVEKENMLN